MSKKKKLTYEELYQMLKNSGTKPSREDVVKAYNQYVTESDDIAPVPEKINISKPQVNSPSQYLTGPAPVISPTPFPTHQNMTMNTFVPNAEVEAEKRKPKVLEPFKKSKSFEDGYQFGDVFETATASAADLGLGVVKSGLGVVEGLGDAVVYGTAWIPDILGADKVADYMRHNIAKPNVVEDVFAPLVNRVDEYSVIGRTLDATAQGVGQMALILGTGGALGATGMASSTAGNITMGMLGMSSVGSGTSEAYQYADLTGKEVTDEQALIYGLGKGAVDTISEMLFGGLGKGVNALGLSRGITSIDDAFAKKLSSVVGNQIAKNFIQYGVKAGAEGTEEVIAGLGSAVLKKLTYMKDEDLMQLIKDENLLEQFVSATLSTAFVQSGYIPGMNNSGTLREANSQERDYITGLNQNEQSVIEKVFEETVNKRTEAGEKLTRREERKIYEGITEALERGELDTDAIGRIFAEETYNRYMESAKQEEEQLVEPQKKLTELKEQLESLEEQIEENSEGDSFVEFNNNRIKNQIEDTKKLIEETESQIEDIKNNSGRFELQEQMDAETFAIVKDSKLAQSYVEKGNRRKKIEVDLDSYTDENAKQSAKNFMEYGANNTKASHDFLELITKVAKDRGRVFKFMTTKQLMESIKNGNPYGITEDAKRVEAFVSGDEIIINMDANKAFPSLVGHEITHSLESDMESYGKFQKALFELAKTRGEYDTRWESIQRRYPTEKGYTEEKQLQELTSDLVGDYIFGDSNFVQNLATENPNVFQKIWNEIKYLWKMATAGSKEKRQLEIAKKKFEDAWRKADNTADSDTKFSVSEDNINKITEDGLTMTYVRNPNAGTANYGRTYGQNLEPAGEYMNMDTSQGKYKIDGWEYGTIQFKKPLVLEHINTGETGWKKTLSEMYGGLTGKRLTRALIKDGYDAIVTQDEYGYSEIVNLNGTKINDSDVQYSLSSMGTTFFGDPDVKADDFRVKDDSGQLRYKSTEGYKQYVDKCLNNMRQTRADFDEVEARKEIETQIEGIVQVAIAAKQAGYDILDYVTNKKGEKVNVRNERDSKKRLLFSSLEPNSEYTTSHDISTICDKRKNFSDIYDEIVRAEEKKGVPKGKRFFDNVDNYFYLHKVMADKGLTQPCRQCYVESMRKNLAPMATAFLELINETDVNNKANKQLYNISGKKKGEIKTNNAKLRERVLEQLEACNMKLEDLSIEMLTTADGLAQLKILAKPVYEAFNSFYGQSKPKMPKQATPFRFGELTALLTDEKGNIKQNLVDKINSTGGFRLQSYSDFQIQNFVDVLQVIFEAGTLGLRGHAYTKVPAFLDATKGTNLKRNISIFMYKDGDQWKIDRNDSFPYSLEEIYKIVEEDKSGNTGIIAVSQNEEMSAWIMANDMIGYGIPFHKSGNKMGTVRATEVRTEDGRTVKGYKDIKDHTRQQTEVWKDTLKNDEGEIVHKANTKVKKGISIYDMSESWDFDNVEGLSKNELIKKNLISYIDACNEAGYLPKFREYVIGNSKFLADVLRYAKKLGTVSQNATIDDISFEYSGYRIPYGYHKFLGDFAMFKPNGESSSHEVLSLKDYDFGEAVKFFKNAKTLRKNELLQQFANGEERAKYRDSDLSNEELKEEISKKRKAVVDEIIGTAKFRLADDSYTSRAYGRQYTGSDLKLEAPVADETIYEETSDNDDIAPVEIEEDELLEEALAKWDEWVRESSNPSQQSDYAPLTEEEANVRDSQREPKVARILTESEMPAKPERKYKAFARAMELFGDKGFVFENLAKKTKNRELEAKWNFTRYSESIGQHFVGKGRGDVRAITDIRDEVMEAGLETELQDYLYHLHNIDRMSLAGRYADVENKPVFGESVTADVSRQVVRELESQYPELKRYAEDIYAVNKYLRKMLVDSGVISQQTADLWDEMYPHYVPINRVDENSKAIDVPLDTKRTGINAPVKQATGGNTDVGALFQTLADRALQTFKAVGRNKFGIELKNTLQSVMDSESVDMDGILDGIDSNEELLQPGKGNQPPTFTVFENGQKVTFAIDEEMYDALMPAGKDLSHTFKIPNTISKIHRGVLTEYNPAFIARNFLKDAQDVVMNSQHPFKTYMNFKTAAKEIMFNGSYYQEYIENGGENNTYFERNTSSFEKKANRTFIRTIGSPIIAIGKVISNANNFIEKVPRMAEYIASRKSGASIEVSMLDAARVTTNFSAGGDVTKYLNRNGATFLNASVQGVMQNVRNVREAKMNGLKGWVQLATKFAVAGLPALLLNGMLWDDDEDYEDLSQYIKDNYYIVAKYGDGKFVRIPKGRMAAVIQNALEQMTNMITGDDEADLGRFLDLVANNLAPNNPIEDNIIAPIAQAGANKTWYGDDLVPTRLQDLPKEEQFDESTDSLSRWLGENTGLSPYKINYLLQQYTGFFGDIIMPMFTPEAESGDDTVGGKIGAYFRDSFTTDSILKNQNVSDFYETADGLKVNANSSKATDEDILKNKYFNTKNTEIGKLYSEKREIQSRSDLTDSEKYYLVKELQKQINEKAETSLDDHANVRINGSYATVGDLHYRLTDNGWTKITDDQIDNMNEVTKGLGITPAEYWNNKDEYDMQYKYPDKYKVLQEQGISVEEYKEKYQESTFMYTDDYDWASKHPDKYAVSKAIADDLKVYKQYTAELSEIEGEKDSNGKTISGSKKKKQKDYIFSLDLDDGQKAILYRSMFNSKADKNEYNADIVEYLNSRKDISYQDKLTILEALEIKVGSDGSVSW